ncbi:MAG: dienelactone hydrolase family protein [Acidimicrobiales bacterium]|nr:dienelactone hydrolase family protein [Acidimicrobiales bacterium]
MSLDGNTLDRETRYRDDVVTYAGVVGENIDIPSRNPSNYVTAMAGPAPGEAADDAVVLDGKLFVPEGAAGATVIVTPGSLGVGPNHEQHAETLVRAGFVVFVLDPFGARSVTSTVANQVQFSFAASAYDVLAAVAVLADRPEVDRSRIAAQGHSRGGAAVTIASSRHFADAVLGDGPRLAAAYAVYPWCGHQFLDADIGDTRLRAIIGERDEWCSVQEAQSQIAALRAGGADASIRIVGNAHHSFDRLEPVSFMEEARVCPNMPTTYLADDGAMIDPIVGEPDPALTDVDLFTAAIERGFGQKGAHIGGEGDQPAVFEADMLAFHARL